MRVVILALVVVMAGATVACRSQAIEKTENLYIDSQSKIISDHVKILADHGRMPVDIATAFSVLGQYGWHTPCGSAIGAQPPIQLLQRCHGGYFGAYSYYEPAFRQADRSWWIIGTMKAGSDLLVAVNRNAKFDRSRDGASSLCNNDDSDTDAYCLEMRGYQPPVLPIGYKVGYMYNGPESATVVEVVNRNTLRLDKHSPEDVLQYDLPILPPDYVDMCACTVGTVN